MPSPRFSSLRLDAPTTIAFAARTTRPQGLGAPDVCWPAAAVEVAPRRGCRKGCPNRSHERVQIGGVDRQRLGLCRRHGRHHSTLAVRGRETHRYKYPIRRRGVLNRAAGAPIPHGCGGTRGGTTAPPPGWPLRPTRAATAFNQTAAPAGFDTLCRWLQATSLRTQRCAQSNLIAWGWSQSHASKLMSWF